MVFLTDGNMKKQFFRVKQLADQTFARAEKTEVLNDDLANKEKRVDNLKKACAYTNTKLQACLQGSGPEDKRLRKLPHFQLASTMEESSHLLGHDTMLGEVLHKCAQFNECLANHLFAYESEVEKLVLRKFLDILEVDIPNINKSRKHLNKLTLDRDAANSRLQAANKHAAQAPGNAKIDTLKDEYDDANIKMEQYRDTLALEFSALLKKEAELSQSLHDLLQFQAEYHRKSLRELEAMLPEIEKAIDNPYCKPTYGQPLEEHLRCRERKIAIPIEACVVWLLEFGMEEEGLLRLAGSNSKVKKLKSCFDEGAIVLRDHDVHTVASSLKQYLRELPEPLMTHSLYQDWMETARHTDKETRLQAMFKVLSDLPNSNYINLRYLIKFLSKLSAAQDLNKMSCINIAIVIAPNLMWPPDDEQAGIGNMGVANTHSSIVDCLISSADYFFPGEEEFYQGLLTSAHFEGVSPFFEPPNEEEDRSGGDQPQNSLDFVEMQASGSSKSPSSNGSPKSTVSPKFNRRPKKPAPPVPPQLRGERTFGESNEEPVKPVLAWPKPTKAAAKPRHERKHSGLSTIELARPSSAETEGNGSVLPSKDPTLAPSASSGATNHLSRDNSAANEWSTIVPRAIQAQLEQQEEAKRAPQAVEKAHVQILSVEKSKPTLMHVPSPTEDAPAVEEEPNSLDKLSNVPPSPGTSRKHLDAEKPQVAEKVKATEDKPKAQEDKPKAQEDKPKAQEDKPKAQEDKPKAPEDKPKAPEDKPKAPEDKPKGPDDKPKVSEDKPKQPQMRVQPSSGPAPERPPRPLTITPADHLQSINERPAVNVKSAEKLDTGHSGKGCRDVGSAMLRALGLHSSHENVASKAPLQDAGHPNQPPKLLRHCTQSLDRSGKLKPPYVNLPNDLDPGDKENADRQKLHKSHGHIPQDVAKKEEEEEEVRGQREGSIPPERPEKFDKAKNVPPARPEKSERLRALLESQDLRNGPGQARTHAPKPEVVKDPRQSSPPQKPARPAYSPSSAAKSERIQALEGETPEKRYLPIYPSLSEVVTTGQPTGSDLQTAPPRSQAPSNASSSPLAPRRPPRPQPRPPLPPPVAKPRSGIGSNQPEETRL